MPDPAEGRCKLLLLCGADKDMVTSGAVFIEEEKHCKENQPERSKMHNWVAKKAAHVGSKLPGADPPVG
jgi:hypothetical protein